MKQTMKHAAMILLGAVTILAAGCAQDVGDINRVQANALKKSDFEGVWYFRQTVTDVPAHIDYTFIGYSSSLEKIRWEVRENFLIAYRSYELTPGRDPEAVARRRRRGAPPRSSRRYCADGRRPDSGV